MNTQRYFDILGITPTKDKEIIKRAYRKKALLYHPDRNPSPEANRMFIEVNDAYERLIEAIDRPIQSRSAQTTRTHTQRQQTHTTNSYEERMQQARMRYQEQMRREQQVLDDYYNKITSGWYWKGFMTVVIASTLLSLTYVLDVLVLPTKQETTYLHYSDPGVARVGLKKDAITPVILMNGDKLWIPHDVVYTSKQNIPLYLEKTRIFNKIKGYTYFFNSREEKQVPSWGIVGSFPLVPLVLILPLVVRLMKRNRIDFMLYFRVVLWAYPILLLFLLFS